MVPYELREGTVFAGDYRVVSPLARGGMGAVYVVDQISTGKRRALKVMSPMLADNPKARERFVQEAKVGGLVDSAHVVEVIAAGIDEPTEMPWLVMELLEGETLQQRLEREGAIEPGVMKEIAIQLRHALALAHERGLVHRDLKPENLFLERARRAGVPFTVKILDFGIAKLAQQAQGRQASGTQALGSPLWMAPEQANAQTITAATDVWSLGLVTFAAITGRVYWRTAATEGDLHLTQLLVEILVDPLAPGSRRAEELNARVLPGRAFDAWLDRCLSRDPAGRFPEAGACLDALVAVLDGGDFRDTGQSFDAVLPTAATALAQGVDPRARTSLLEPETHEPIVHAEAPPQPPTRDHGSSGMGLGQIAALLAGSLLIACMAIFGGVMGFAVFAGSEDDAVAISGADTTAPPDPNGIRANDPLAPTTPTLTPTPLRPIEPTQPSPDPRPQVATLQPQEVFGPDPQPTDPPVKRDPRRLPVSRSAAGQALYRATIAPCWRDELQSSPHGPTRMELELQLGPSGTNVSNIQLPGRWQGTPFARCVVTHLPATRFETPPSSTHVVLDLPGAP